MLLATDRQSRLRSSNDALIFNAGTIAASQQNTTRSVVRNQSCVIDASISTRYDVARN
jgi:hypothetical protein